MPVRIYTYLIIILFTPTLILTNFRLLIYSENFYFNEFAKLNVYQNFISINQAQHLTKNLIQYLCCQEDLDASFFTATEQFHLKDVKNLIGQVNIYFWILLISELIIIIILLYKKQFAPLVDSLSWASMVSFISLAILSVFSIINFDFIFTKFHVLVFDNDYWLIPPSSNLIKLFPPQFFVDFANRIARNSAILAGVVLAISFFIRRTLAAKKF